MRGDGLRGRRCHRGLARAVETSLKCTVETSFKCTVETHLPCRQLFQKAVAYRSRSLTDARLSQVSARAAAPVPHLPQVVSCLVKGAERLRRPQAAPRRKRGGPQRREPQKPLAPTDANRSRLCRCRSGTKKSVYCFGGSPRLRLFSIARTCAATCSAKRSCGRMK